MTIDLFPKVVVTGPAFCNRNKEREQLGRYIMMGRHVWIQAHRRHGKTSLVAQTVKDIAESNKVAYTRCHLRFASDSQSAIKKIIQSVDQIISQILTDNHPNEDVGTIIQKYTEILNNAFRKIKPSISIQGTRPVISTTQVYDLTTLDEAFYGLDKIASKFSYRATMLLDEFQEIRKCDSGIELESVIRQAVEDATSTTFIFAGSEKTLMEQALNEKSRPLYKHTQPLILKRISATSYRTHLNKLATNKWGKALSKGVLDKVIFYTQRHPYYVNALCDELWELDTIPSAEDVKASWEVIVFHSSREDGYEIRSLTPNDKKIVISIANGTNTKMTSARVLTKMSIAASSITASLESLIKRDIIDKDKDTYFIVNPALTTLLMRE